MATERITETNDGAVRQRVTERSGGGMAAAIIGIALLALVAIVGFYFLNANRNDAIRTDAVAGAASSVGRAADSAAQSVGQAAESVADGAQAR